MRIKNSKLKIIFFGSSSYVIPILEVLHKNFDLKLVLTTEKPAMPADNPKFNLALQGETLQGETLRSYPATKYCIEHKIPYLSVSNLSDPSLTSHFSSLISPVGVLADFGLIIPKEILNMFPKGIINIHPSLLPKYRGPTPVQTAILNGEKTTGVSIIKLDEEIDHGPILTQEKEEILPTDTSETLYKRLFEKGANLLLKILPVYTKGNLNPIAQNHSKATFTRPLTRQDGYIEISNLKSQISNFKLKRMIKAYYPWPGTWSKLRLANRELRIKFLPDQKIQVEGKKPMTYKDFANGYEDKAKEILKLFS